MQDVHITCILILEFMRKTPAFEFNTFSICIILQTVCIICLNNSSCSFQDTKLFQFSFIDSQHRDKHHTLIFDNYEKKAWLQLFRFGSAYGSVYYFRITDNVHTKENSLTAFPLFFVFTWWISNIFKIIFVSMSLLPAWSLSFFFTYLTKFPNFSLEIYWKHTPQVVASCSDPKDHGTNKILAFWHICIKLRYTLVLTYRVMIQTNLKLNFCINFLPQSSRCGLHVVYIQRCSKFLPVT